MRPKLRFDVFKRDSFACAYCGRTPPLVLLEVDHVHPVADGGEDEIENLVTACEECNRGKGAVLLGEKRLSKIKRSSIIEMRERAKQAKAYYDMLTKLEAVTTDFMQLVWRKWIGCFQGKIENGYYVCDTPLPEARSLKYFLKHISTQEILEAVDISLGRWGAESGTRPTKYFYGVCHKMIKDAKAERDADAETP